jgi:hypothetical protein
MLPTLSYADINEIIYNDNFFITDNSHFWLLSSNNRYYQHIRRQQALEDLVKKIIAHMKMYGGPTWTIKLEMFINAGKTGINNNSFSGSYTNHHNFNGSHKNHYNYNEKFTEHCNQSASTFSNKEERARKLLEVHKDASFQEIKTAYRKLQIKYHPDKNHHPEAIKIFQEIGTAFEFLEKILNKTGKETVKDKAIRILGILNELTKENYIQEIQGAFDYLTKEFKKINNPSTLEREQYEEVKGAYNYFARLYNWSYNK